MASTTVKKLDIQLSVEVYKAAKTKAAQAGQPLSEWVASLIAAVLQQEEPEAISALDWGRIDSRIDQRTALLERQIEKLTNQVEQLAALNRSSELTYPSFTKH
jgi:hypothetical protein